MPFSWNIISFLNSYNVILDYIYRLLELELQGPKIPLWNRTMLCTSTHSTTSTCVHTYICTCMCTHVPLVHVCTTDSTSTSTRVPVVPVHIHTCTPLLTFVMSDVRQYKKTSSTCRSTGTHECAQILAGCQGNRLLYIII